MRLAGVIITRLEDGSLFIQRVPMRLDRKKGCFTTIVGGISYMFLLPVGFITTGLPSPIVYSLADPLPISFVYPTSSLHFTWKLLSRYLWVRKVRRFRWWLW